MRWSLDRGGGSGRLHDRQRHIRAFLRQHPVGVLSTVGPDGNPHGVMIYFTIDEQFVIRVLTRKGRPKHDDLLHYNHVMLTVFDVQNQTSIQVTGLAFERADRTAVTSLTRQIRELTPLSITTPLPFEQLQAGELTTFMIEPVQMRMARYAPPSIGDHQELFDTIETFSPAS